MRSEQDIQSELLAVPIMDNEIFELLGRLAATEEMFKQPVSTIRDVAELTDASPNLIARILGDMRGTSEFENLSSTVDGYGQRISKIEEKLEVPTQFGRAAQVETLEPNATADWIVRVGTKVADYLDRFGMRKHALSIMTLILILAILFTLICFFWMFDTFKMYLRGSK